MTATKHLRNAPVIRLRPVWIAAALAFSLISTPRSAAQPTGGSTMVFQGHLELHGLRLTGIFNFKVEIYHSAEEGDCAATMDGCLWSTEILGVQVMDGAFELALGTDDSPLPEELWLNEEVFLSLRVAADGDPYTRLSGRQRILPVPFAARAAIAPDFHIAGDLIVEPSSQAGLKNTTVGGDAVVVGAAAVSGGLVVTQQTPRTFDVTATGQVRAATVNAVRFFGELPGQATGAITVECDSTSAWRRSCSSWGAGNCTGPVNNICGSAVSCTTGTLRQTGGSGCWSASGGWSTYCQHFICVR